MQLKAIRGTRDILPGEAISWNTLETTSRRIFALYGYQEIRTPIFEDAALFSRSVGETTDIVEKEMYTFTDRGERQVSLRPEATAPVVRAYLEHALHKTEALLKLFYLGPMFRAERPQAGRSRQFHQVGVEVIGSATPYADAEVIELACRLLNAFGASGFQIKLNSLGCREDRKKLSLLLRKAASEKAPHFCEDCRRRIDRNVFRVLDCKNETCRAQAASLPSSLDHLCQECQAHFSTLKKLLEEMGVTYAVDPHLVRGLDYYTRTAFEITHPALGAKDAVGAGGRYDGLVEELGGPSVPAVGFALGLERVLLILEKLNVAAPESKTLDVFWVTIGEESKVRAFAVMRSLREKGVSTDIDLESRSVKAQMRLADKRGTRFVAILGEDELKANAVTLKNMATGEEKKLSLEDLAREVAPC